MEESNLSFGRVNINIHELRTYLQGDYGHGALSQGNDVSIGVSQGGGDSFGRDRPAVDEDEYPVRTAPKAQRVSYYSRNAPALALCLQGGHALQSLQTEEA